MSQRQLAPRCGVDRTTIQKVEAGRLVPSVELARRIEAELGVEPESIFGAAQACGCGCGAATFSAHLPGHAPKAGGPVQRRKDRAELPGPGTRLRALRIQLGLTQAELADIVASRPSTIASVERGRDLPGERLARALGEAVGVLDLFPLEPCPCGCDGMTVGGRFLRGHRPRSDEERLKLSTSKREFWDSDESAALRAAQGERWREGWQRGDTPQRALLEAAKEGRTPIPISGRTRQRYSGRWGARAAPKTGGRPRGRQLSEDVVLRTPDVLRRHEDGQSVRAIAQNTSLSRRQVEGILRREKVSPKPSD